MTGTSKNLKYLHASKFTSELFFLVFSVKMEDEINLFNLIAFYYSEKFSL